MEPVKVQVTAKWDPEALVWVAESDDVPGLITEADTMVNLRNKLEVLIPELLHENSPKLFQHLLNVTIQAGHDRVHFQIAA